MSIIVSNCQHCEEQQYSNTVMCTLNDFLSIKVRFIHTSTVTGSDSFSGKNTRTPRVRLAYILFLLKFHRPISPVVIGRKVDYRSRLTYVRYGLTNTTLCL